MLKKVNRLSGFRQRAGGQSLDTPLFRVKKFSVNEPSIKFGFVVSKKIDKRAVVRNETKRVLKKCVKALIENLNKGNMVIIIAKSKLTFEKKEVVGIELENAFKKLKLIK